MYWRLHQAIFRDRLYEAVAIAQSFGDTVQAIEGNSLSLPESFRFDRGRPALAMTTLQDARRQNGFYKGLCTPWLFFDEQNYSVSRWLPNIDHSIPVLNRSGIFVPFGELKCLPKALLESLGGELNSVFIKPDKGHKAFTGHSIPVSHWPPEYGKGGIDSSIDHHILCFLSKDRRLEEYEWRFWIVNRTIAAYSPYSWRDHSLPWIKAPENVIAVAEQMASNPWQPDLSYVVDVVVDEEGVAFVNEINAASTSGVYATPLLPLMSSLREICHLEFDGEITL